MRLIRLRLQNFRQHVDTEINFRPGLTGIIGPNGAGKSTILEAIAWAIYGSPAARGTNDTIRFARAPGRARVLVELTFELGGIEYKVTRTLNDANVVLDNSPMPVASGLGVATSWLEARLGMNREEFFNTYFTGQKELQFLAQMGPTQRGRFLGQVLGYERLRIAQERIRTRRNELRHEIDGLRANLPDAHALRTERERAEERVAAAKQAVKDGDRELKAARKQVKVLQPQWESAQRSRDQAREAAHAAATARAEQESARRDVERITKELQAIAESDAQLAIVREKLLILPDLEAECRRFEELARLAERRKAREENLASIAADLKDAEARLKTLEQAPALLKQYSEELKSLKVQVDEAEATARRLADKWAEDKQDTRTKLQQHLTLHDELAEQIRQLTEAGPDGTCPTCTRPLGAEFDRVLGLLQEQFDDVKQNGKWLRKRESQLKERPEDLVAAEEARRNLQQALRTCTEREARCTQAVQELWNLTAEKQRKEALAGEITAELAGMPSGYDRDAHAASEAKLAELRNVARLASRLEHAVESRAVRERELHDANARVEACNARIAVAEARIAEFAFDEAAYDQLRSEFERHSTALRDAELAATERKGRLDAAEEHLATICQQEKAAEEARARLDEVELDLRHHHELYAALDQLRQELNARVRPELSELASIFLNDITDGRYTSLEIDDGYNVLVLDEGEEKPVISGGEEDVANLVLRIAISQMIAERAGQQLSVLFLDEVFGSLDIERRDNVIQLLHKLEDRFEQVILITHIETVREGLDHVVRVDFDPKTGASAVREDAAPQLQLVP